MNAGALKKYAMLFATVVLMIGIANTVARRVPVVGPVVKMVMDGL